MSKNFFIPFFAFIFGILLLTTSVFALTGYASPTKVILNGDIGKTFQRHLLIKNINDVPVNVILSTDYSNIHLTQTNFRLESGSNKTVDFDVTIDQEGEVDEDINIEFKPDSGSSVSISTLMILTGSVGNGTDNQSNSSDNNSTSDGNQTDITGNQDVFITADLDPQTPNIIEGSDMIINVILKNTGDVETEYNVTAYDYQDFADLLMIYPENIKLNPGESGNVLMHFYIKNNITGYQEYKVKVNYGNFYKEEPVSMMVDYKYPENLTDIAYVVNNPSSPDYNFINIINSLGYNYDIIGSSSVSTTDFSHYKMILIGDERISNVPVNNYKSLIANPDYYKNFSQSKSTTTKGNNMYNLNQNISITNGLNQSFTAYVQTGISLYYLTGAKYNSKSVTTAGNSGVDKGHFVIATKDSPRRVFFGITKSNYWSDESKQLFMNSIDWLINGEDRDNDSFMSDYDCNDSNSGVWRNVLAYIDKDNDSYGAGALVNVCIGNNLPPGYSYINGDCNDNDAGIHPNSLEIPYDGIDQKCIGYDLADVDLDGYCKLGYVIQNATLQCPKETGLVGTDCNDLDPSVNLGSSDVFKNCKNDAPIIDNIDNIIVNEGENVVITVNAIDPENDNMTYSINDSRFIKDNNVFTWNTSYDDYGNYLFNISVSDGTLTSSIDVEVVVDNQNRAPICSEIPPIVWDENSNISLNLSQYCSDPDNDTISYSFYDTSDNNINVLNINGDGIIEDNGNAIISSSKYWYGKGWIQFIATDGNDETLTNQINVSVNHINQAPEFSGKIGNITLYEDTNSTNKINLGDYFSDIDSNLSYSVTGNNNIGVEINNGYVNFYPAIDFVGNESIVFSASDLEFNVSSNEIFLNVLYVNKPPKFGEINCPTGILENNQYNCELNASDIENDSFNFSVINENNLNCKISGNNLNYSGAEDYYGNASCTLRVSDETGYNDYVLNTEIEHVNQPPRIYSYSPINNNIKILENTNKEFRISARDVDGDNMTINWLIGNEIVGSGYSFNFNKPMGLYNLTALVSDLEFNSSNSWSVFVGGINDFKCSEVGGHLCDNNQICNGNILGVYDGGNCCSVTCSNKPLEFNGIKRIENNITTNTLLTLIYPLNGSVYHTGDELPVELNIENNADNSVDFDVYVYLYDFTKQSIVEKATDSFKLSKSTTKTSNLKIQIPEKINENDEFYVFAKIEGKNGKERYYNEKYSEVKITRKSDDVLIDNVLIEPKDILCGDIIHMTIKLRNYGLKTEDANLKISNSELNINQNTPDFTIDSFNDSNNGDIIVKNINLNLSNSAPAGNYTIKASVYFAGQYNTVNNEIILGECKTLNTETEQVVTTTTPDIKLESKTKVSQPILPLQQNGIIILISTISMLIIFILVMIAGRVYKRNQNVDESINKFIKNKIRKKRK